MKCTTGARFTVARRSRPCPVRCNHCGRRRTLSKTPAEYARPPRCRRCNKPLTYIDHWRIAHEWRAKGCHCGSYAFPHARGRGYCLHNPKLTADDLRRREEGDRPVEIAPCPF